MNSHWTPDHLAYFHFCGRFVAKALLDSQRLDAYFTQAFYKHILAIAPTERDVESIDPDQYKALQWMLENSIEGVVELTFSAENSEFGKTEIIDLIPNGRNLPVTDANKQEYVKLISEFKLTASIRQQLDAFLKGFREMIPLRVISLFNERELELLICGLPKIDLADFRANVDYSGLSHTDEQVLWWWQCVEEMSQKDLALLVQFVTGTSKVPLEGFKALQGSSGPTKFTITKGAGIDALPSSHTCFNTIDLPTYTSKETMRTRLLTAIREGSQGFGFR